MAYKQEHQSLVEQYNSVVRFVKKYGMTSMMMQISIILLVSGWKYSEIGYYKIAAPILFSLSIYFLSKDFLVIRRMERNMTQMILDGVELEKKHSVLKKFFHGSLQSFNFTNTLVQRSLINALALVCLGYLIFQFISDAMPDIKINRWFFSLFVWIPSVIACKLYYDSLKVLDEAKERVFSKQN